MKNEILDSSPKVVTVLRQSRRASHAGALVDWSSKGGGLTWMAVSTANLMESLLQGWRGWRTRANGGEVTASPQLAGGASGVQFIGGKPGGGKSLLATMIILDELKNSNRIIVTNMRLNLNEIAAYFRANLWDWRGEGENWLASRIVLLDDDQISEFYRYRGPEVKLPMVAGVAKGQQQADYSQCPARGVLYVLDEVHIAFNSRRWQDTGPAVMHYLSQHRKLGDAVILISQAIQNVDKQMRSVAQDFTYVRNLAKERHGLFRMPGIFVKRVFLELPTSESVKAIQTGTFRLDVQGVGKCYDTNAGIGIVGRSGGDIGQRAKGLPWWSFLVIIGAVIWALMHFTPGIVEWVITGGKHTAKTVASAPVLHPAVSNMPVVRQGPAVTNTVTQVPSQLDNGQTNRVYVSGCAWLNGVWNIMLSDGRILRERAPRIDGRTFIIDGVKYDASRL